MVQKEFSTLGISANKDTFVTQRGEPRQALVPIPPLKQTNNAKCSLIFDHLVNMNKSCFGDPQNFVAFTHYHELSCTLLKDICVFTFIIFLFLIYFGALSFLCEERISTDLKWRESRRTLPLLSISPV